MQALKVKTVNIRAFRGIPRLELTLDGKSILLKGENGTGKSSIVEAIEFFFSGRVSHLEGSQGISFRRHAPHALHKLEDVGVEITFDPGNIVLMRTFNSEPTPPKHLAMVFQASSSGTFILRRSQILEFIESDPGKRFTAIGNIMGVSRLDSVELEMMRLRDELEGTVESDEEQQGNLFHDLTALIGEPTQTLKEALQNLNKKAIENGYPEIKSFKLIDKYAQAIFKSVKGKLEEADQVRKLREIVALVEEPVVSDEEMQKLRGFAQRSGQLILEGTNAEVAMFEFLERGKNVLEAIDESICPFCGQQIDQKELVAAIEERIRVVSQLTTEASSMRTDSVGIIKNLEAVGRRLDSLRENARHVKGLTEQVAGFTAEGEFLQEFIEGISGARDLRSELRLDEFLIHNANITDSFVSIGKGSRSLLEKVELTEDEKKILEFVQLLGSVKSKIAEITSLEGQLETQKQYYKVAEMVYTRFSGAKRAAVQTTYDALESDIQRYFSKLHPNEGARSLTLRVSPTRRASTRLLIDSLGKPAQDPRALESEGHLDSLGICIFLAFVKKFNVDCPLVILDDVVTTIDAGHRQRLAEVLVEEFEDKQLIITTHDEAWFEQFLGLERANNLGSSFKNLEIVGWDLNSGPRIRGYKPRWESLEDRIKNADKLGAGNEGRRYLEWILENICEEMEVPVTFNKDARYEIRDLLPPVRKRILVMLEGSGQGDKFDSAFKELEKTIAYGNLLSHNNVFASEISIEEVRSFLLAIKNIHSLFSCPDCESFLSYYRDLAMIRCSNGKCRNPAEIRLHH